MPISPLPKPPPTPRAPFILSEACNIVSEKREIVSQECEIVSEERKIASEEWGIVSENHELFRVVPSTYYQASPFKTTLSEAPNSVYICV